MHYITEFAAMMLWSFSMLSLIKDDCYQDEKQQCDLKAVLKNRTDASAVDSALRYFLFTRKDPNKPEMLHLCNGTLPKNTNFNAQNRLIVIIPGFVYGVCQFPIISKMKDEFLKKDDYNVLLIDTTKAYGLDYLIAIQRLPTIAGQVAKVFQNIQDQTGIKNEKLYLIGHSLGAHLSAQISRRFGVYRITALDAAGISFDKHVPTENRLDNSDAYLVDVYHCNGANNLPGLAVMYPTGDADFYINGGSVQKGCLGPAGEAIKNFDFMFAVAVTTVPSFCAHFICLEYYYLSINNEYGYFKAQECDSYKDFRSGKCAAAEPVLMGFDYEKNFTHGEEKKPFPLKYYVNTRAKWPYLESDLNNIKTKLS